MSIWNKVLIGLIVVASLGFFYLAGRTLMTHRHWRESAHDHIHGKGEGPSYRPGIDWYQDASSKQEDDIQALELQLRKMTANRGRVWTGCKPQPGPQTQKTGQVSVATDAHGIGQKTLLYVFDESDVRKGGRYLGEFKVLAVDEANGVVGLQPSMTMTTEELQRLAAGAAGNATWTMYEIMPSDNHEIFADLDEARLRELWPAGSPHEQEYTNDDKPATWEKIEQWGARGTLVDDEGKPLVDEQGQPIETAEGTYQRWLRDYDVLLKDCRLQRSKLLDLREAAARDLAYVESALAEADEQRKYREREKALLTTQKQQHEYQRAATYELLQKLTKEVKAYRDAVNTLIADNIATADKIDKNQQDAKRRIEARTSRMAQSGTAGN